MSKPPPNVPSIGDRVRMRGRNSVGELMRVNDRNWATVRWDTDVFVPPGPDIVHLHELEKEP